MIKAQESPNKYSYDVKEQLNCISLLKTSNFGSDCTDTHN